MTRKGNAIAVGAWSPELITALVRALLTEAGIQTMTMPSGDRRTKRGDREFWLNFNQYPVEIDGGPTIQAVGYATTSANMNPSYPLLPTV